VAALAEINQLTLTPATYLADVATARRTAGDRAPALLETVLLRRKATSKMDDPSAWLFTDDALQQATPQPVAEHRAQRLVGRDVHDVTCSIGMDLAATARSARAVIGSDLEVRGRCERELVDLGERGHPRGRRQERDVGRGEAVAQGLVPVIITL